MANLSDKQILKNAFPKWAEGEGLFAAMTDMPWSASVDGLILDIEYFGNRSGLKFCSPIIYNFLGDDGAVTENGRTTIARVLSTRYKKQWQRLWDTYDSEYEPLDNYDMSEEETRETTGTDNFTDTRNDSRTVTEDITDTRNLQQSHTGTDTNVAKNVSVGESSSVNSRNGFNSSDPNGVPVQNQTNRNQSTVDSTDTETKNLSDTDTGTVKRDGTTEDELNGNLTRDRDTSESETINRHRHGLNGLRSRQEIIEAEREVWMWDYFGQVFRDVDKVLTLAIFDPCKVQSTGLYDGGSGGEQYVLPVATNNQLGGVRAPARIPGATTPIYVDSAGYLYTVPQKYPPPYVLPIASPTILGGVKPDSKTDDMVEVVGVDSEGKLWTKQSGGGGGITEVPLASADVIGGIKASPIFKPPLFFEAPGNMPEYANGIIKYEKVGIDGENLSAGRISRIEIDADMLNLSYNDFGDMHPFSDNFRFEFPNFLGTLPSSFENAIIWSGYTGAKRSIFVGSNINYNVGSTAQYPNFIGIRNSESTLTVDTSKPCGATGKLIIDTLFDIPVAALNRVNGDPVNLGGQKRNIVFLQTADVADIFIPCHMCPIISPNLGWVWGIWAAIGTDLYANSNDKSFIVTLSGGASAFSMRWENFFPYGVTNGEAYAYMDWDGNFRLTNKISFGGKT